MLIKARLLAMWPL